MVTSYGRWIRFVKTLRDNGAPAPAPNRTAPLFEAPQAVFHQSIGPRLPTGDVAASPGVRDPVAIA